MVCEAGVRSRKASRSDIAMSASCSGIRDAVRFETSIDISAGRQRVWEVVSDLEAWPRRIETVDTVELLTPSSS